MSTDPTALAREVLDLAHEDETVTVCSIPDNKAATLARAVIRVEALAGMLGHEANNYTGDERETAEHYAARIRAALNEETPNDRT